MKELAAWHAEPKKVVDYVQKQEATLGQQAVESSELLRDLEAARWGPVASLPQASDAAAAVAEPSTSMSTPAPAMLT